MVIKVINKKTGKEIARHSDSLDEIYKLIKKALNRDYVFYRRRISFDLYVIDVWTANPVTTTDAENVAEIHGVSRKIIKKSEKHSVDGVPIKKPEFKPKEPKPPIKLPPIITPPKKPRV